MTQEEFVRLITGEEVLGTTLLVWAVDRLGPKLFDWHPSTVHRAFNRAAQATLPERNFDRLMAAWVIHQHDLFFARAECFALLTGALCGHGMEFDQFVPPDPEDCAWAIAEAQLLHPATEEDPEPFSREVRAALGVILQEHGYLVGPSVLGIATGLPGLAAMAARYADDPALVATIKEAQDARNQQIEAVVRSGLAALAGQLASLRLETGDARDWAARLEQTLHAA